MSKIDLTQFNSTDLDKCESFLPILSHYKNINYSDLNDLNQSLKFKRNQSWSKLAISNFLQQKMPISICKDWSLATDEIVIEVFEHFFQDSEVALFAMGKWGSFELNLSSDIDLVLVQKNNDSTNPSQLRKFQNLLSSRDQFGFLYRLDFDLRPGGKSSTLIPTVDEYQDYYIRYGETWEKLALSRIRFICGNSKIADEILPFTKKFCFQKHLDYSLFDELKNLREKIHSQYWKRSSTSQVDLKLGVGGIRDIELFLQAIQVIHGGKDKSLQILGVHQQLKTFEEKKLLPEEDIQFIDETYWKLRFLENYVQSRNDEQTHLLLKEDNHPSEIIDCLNSLDLEKCDQLVSSLLGNKPDIKNEQRWENVKNHLNAVENSLTTLDELLEIEVKSKNKTRDEKSKKNFLLYFIELLIENHGDVKLGLSLLKDFFFSTRSKGSFFLLLEREKKLIEKLSWLFGHSPYLSSILIQRPELLDSFVYQAQDDYSDDLEKLLEQLIEAKLLSEIHNGIELLASLDIFKIQSQLSSLADQIALKLLNWHNSHFQTSLQILCLGKWGGQELGIKSDLDFIFVSDEQPTELDIKVSRRIISRMTEPHKGGSIYNIDMRLRPTGKAGPLVVCKNDLINYLQSESEPWERQVYLKSRPLQKDENFLQKIHKAIFSKDLKDKDWSKLNSIRLQLIKNPPDAFDLKYSEGGLLDLELFIQSMLLETKLEPEQNKNTDSFFKIVFAKTQNHQIEKLRIRYALLRCYEQCLQLVSPSNSSVVLYNSPTFQQLTNLFQESSDSLKKHINNEVHEILGALIQLDPRRRSG